MATTEMYREALERLKHELSPEEKDAIMKAQNQMKTHLRIGALAGGGLGYGLTTVRKFRGFQKAAIIFGGLVIGSQLGFVSGTLSGINTIKNLPNSDHILKTITSIQQEMKTSQDQRKSGIPRQPQQQQQPMDGENTALSRQFEQEQTFNNPYDASLNRSPQRPQRATQNTQNPLPQQQSGGWFDWGKQKPSEIGIPQPAPPSRPRSEFDTPPPIDSPSTPQQVQNRWDQLRGPGPQQPSAWDKIRQEQGQRKMKQQTNTRDAGNADQSSYSFSKSYEESQLPTDKDASFKESAWREEQPRGNAAQSSGASGVQFGEDFSRTREDFGNDPTTSATRGQRTNKYGDVY